jgi:diadenosine tetraphosphate (Ap4A) HIT family hydrolase
MPYDRGCLHCNPTDPSLEHRLLETKSFRIVADVHPLTEGHVLIIPKSHLSCTGEFSSNIFNEFESLYLQFSLFLHRAYGKISTFEHGKIGQTVFHAHVHLLPYDGPIGAIVPEEKSLIPVDGIRETQKYFQKDGQYLFVSIGRDSWMVDAALGQPRFFRDRFAEALGVPERGNWKTMHENAELMGAGKQEILSLARKYLRALGR